ncbi:hypothetical protein CHUAL_008212 [Chamberlinius hualienensis]
MNLSSIVSGTKPSQVPGIYWSRLITKGDGPTPRVGHTATATTNRRIYLVGGANPNGSFSDTYLFNLDDFKWTQLPAKLNKQRYEHCSVYSSDKIIIFGGSNENGNLNDVETFNECENQWQTLTINNSPCSRTHHTTDIVDGNMIVFAGGSQGPEPVDDLSVYSLNPTDKTWTKYESNGEIPSARQGHLIVAMQNNIYIHGGISGDEFFDDLYVFNLVEKRWSLITRKDEIQWPCGRAGHGGSSVADDCFIIFGGLTASGALNDSYLFNTVTEKWEKLENEGEVPAPRLDFAFTKIPMGTQLSIETFTEESSKEMDESVGLIFLNGGMDTNGDVYDDSYIACIKV